MTTRNRKRARWASVALVIAALGAGGLLLAAPGTSGGSTRTALTFAGNLQTDTGAPLSGSHELRFVLDRGGTTCTHTATVTPAGPAGGFSVEIPLDACPSLFDGADVTVDITLDGTTNLVTDAPVNPVPYAKYADRASRVVLPACSATQVLAVDGAGGFTCANALSAPTCSSGDVLTSNAGVLSCVDPAVANATIAQLGTDLGLLTSRVTTAESNITSLSATVSGHTSTLTVLDSRLDTAESTLISVDTRLDTAESTLITLDTRLDTAESSLISLDGRLDTLEPAVTQLQTDVVALDARLDALEAAGSTQPVLVGRTTATTSARIQSAGSQDGLPSAAALCSAQFGAGAHMCTGEEMYFSHVLLGTTEMTNRLGNNPSWVWFTNGNEPIAGPTQSFEGQADNCGAYTYPTADTAWKATTVSYRANALSQTVLHFKWNENCFNVRPIACCQ